jgi:hypothetical protein
MPSALNAESMMRRTRKWAEANHVEITSGSQQVLLGIFRKAEENLSRGDLSQSDPSPRRRPMTGRQLNRKLHTLLRKMLAASPDHIFHEYTAPNTLAGLCPGFWPFC